MVTMKAYQNAKSVGLATVHHAAQLGLLLAVGLSLSACKQEAKVTPGNGSTGVYTLVTVNGNKVPASISHDGVAVEIRSGSFTINADGTCASKTCFVPPKGTEVTREVSATYTREGSRLNMRWQGAGQTTGTLEGNTFTMDNEGMVLAYKK